MQKQIVDPLDLKTYPAACLRTKTVDVKDFTEETRGMVRAMADLMYKNQGIGLAAPQAGLGLSIVIVDAGCGLKVFINPKVVKRSREKDTLEEGCLSLPGVGVNVARPKEIEIRAKDRDGNVVSGKFDGLEAKAIQHEIDHLYGKLIIDYMNPVARFISAGRFKREMRKKRFGDTIKVL
ncbi:MAG: peptide deformylase [Candidatus Omnitrophica bacterium]|nr:peptide deformylase [Candidatus Omnitrophota bacterium]MBU1128738.1 peptide deformylase [Candidatus Omnitrophota bacterium]MBU1657328.1 peptide deformylase [Candidatus Omnitrophota bacterium]MBU1784006.1 peptide deformylase [Candidatus Omnitrophota bacterium]MBU1851783.1 peptide deformylase [Candidatus Omnitrophota bacterium]